MTRSEEPKCSAGCPMCPMTTGGEGLAAWRAAHEEAAAKGLRGWKLLARSAGAFGVPIIGALAGVIMAGGGESRRFVGLIGGLAAAMIVSILLGRILRHRPSEPTCNESPAARSAGTEESI